MTLISAGYIGSRSGSPASCSDHISYCPDYGGIEGSKTAKNVDTCRTTLSSSLPQPKTFVERMKNVNIRLSLEDLSKCMVREQHLRQPSATTSLISHSTSCAVDRRRYSKDALRSILKKSASADSASIALLKDKILGSRRLSMSDSNLSLNHLDDYADGEPVEGPRSPSKSVTFADDNNLSLVKIHNFERSNDCLDQWQFETLFQTNFRSNSRVSGDQAMVPVKGKIVRKPVELLLCFKEPRGNPDFEERFNYKCVALERCATRDRTLTGIVMVKNIEFEKHVSVRYTLDRWKTTDDIVACYVPNSNDGETDRFSFTLSLPKSYMEMEFAIRYKTGSAEYWDNNYNRNYKVRDALSLLAK